MKVETRVIGPVQRFLDKEVDGKDRRNDIIHPSELSSDKWCIRHDYYRISGVPFEPKKIRFGLRNIFDEGHHIHDKWQERLWKMGILGGNFKCKLCGFKWDDTSPQQCPQCLNSVLKYAEVGLYNEEYNIGGHADGRIDDGADPALLEVKSVAIGTVRFADPGLLRKHTLKVDGRTIVDYEALWKDITRPFDSHLRQINLYMFLSGIHDAVVIYENKVTQAVKEFVISFTPAIVEPMLEDALDLGYALEKSRVPERPTWASEESGECKKCPFFGVCYEASEASTEPVGESRGRAARTPRRWREAPDDPNRVDRTDRREPDGDVREPGPLGRLFERAAGSSGDRGEDR